MAVPASSSGISIERYGRYYLFDRVGVGGMAEVFKAVGQGPQGFRQVCVVKRILPELSADPSFTEMFIDEAKICAALQHPNIVQVFEFGEVGGRYFLTMEYLHGRNLLKLLGRLYARREFVPVPMAAYIAQQVALGLDHAHTLTDPAGTPLNLVHRDITPANIMLLATGGVKILDFGIVKAAAMVRMSTTKAGVVKGKRAYLSPEQIHGAHFDGRTDIFALGVVLWEMLTGRPLFAADNEITTGKRILEMPVPPPSERRDEIPPELDHITLRALERNPADRYPSAAAMAEDLEEYLHGARYASQSLPQLLRKIFSNELAGGTDTGLPPELLQALQQQAGTPSAGAALGEARTGEVDAPRRAPDDVPTDASKRLQVGSASRRRVVRRILGAAAAVAGLATWIALRSPSPQVRPAPTTLASPAPAAVAEPAAASITIDSKPQGASVYGPGDVLIGQTPTTLSFPRSMQPVSLTLRNEGYEEEAYTVVPDRDRAAMVYLRPAAKPEKPVVVDKRRQRGAGARSGDSRQAPARSKIKSAEPVDPFK